MKRVVVGILAHVDAGKTTFSEQVLCRAGVIRAAGRVDHGDAFLDAHPLERQRGITIFSDQAVFELNGKQIFWVDTPGHADFAAEMARAVSVIDCAVVLVSGAEGVQSHTETIWALLGELKVPAFIFVNKTDRAGYDPEGSLSELKRRLSADCVDMAGFTGGAMPGALRETVAERDEALLEMLLAGEWDDAEAIQALKRQIRNRELFPVYRGAALNGTGVSEFMEALALLAEPEPLIADAPFDALVYKVRRDAQGNRLTFFRVLAGSVGAREAVALPGGETAKLNELRLYSGEKYRQTPRAEAGMLAAATGLPGVRPGDRIGAGAGTRNRFAVEPMLAASAEWARDIPIGRVLAALRTLEEEDPALNVSVNDAAGTIDVDVMGPIQLEVLKQLLKDRFGLSVDFGKLRVMYQETIADTVIGIGHYEPLKHYAEVQLRLSPGPRGSGITFESRCHVDELSLNWQRLIETHVFEKAHRGVLIGARLTDVKVELLHGRAHQKHTEGGDFRQSVYRAIRNGLMYAESVLLEPICRFSLRGAQEDYGRVMGDLTRMQARVSPPEMGPDGFALEGEAPFAEFSGYIPDFMAATHGRGALRYRLDHYAPCRDARAVIEAAHYNPLADDTPDSVFCSHGAGYSVPWNEVREHAHTLL